MDEPDTAMLGKAEHSDALSIDSVQKLSPPNRIRSLCVPWTRLQRANFTWRSGLYAGLYASLAVLLINLTLLILGCVSQKGISSGIGTIAQGRPKHIQRMSTSYHVLINILSTVLLISSNYAMQILCAPTREELDISHRKGKRLDIGLVSIHNLRHIGKKRVVLFWMLACSSVPLHVLYNSAVFQVTAGQDYTIDFAYAPTATPESWTRMENHEWTHLYDTPYVPGYGNLRLVITDFAFDLILNPNWTMSFQEPSYESNRTIGGDCDWVPSLVDGNSTRLSFGLNLTSKSFGSLQTDKHRAVMNYAGLRNFSLSPYEIPEPVLMYIDDAPKISERLPMCNNLGCDVTKCPENGWLSLRALRVGYGFAEPVDHSSKVQIAVPFLVIVLVSNAVKAIAIFLTLRSCSADHITTVGDAVATYLERPEALFAGKCMVERDNLLRESQKDPKRWKASKTHMVRMLGRSRRWSSLLLLGLAVLNITSVFISNTHIQKQFPGNGKSGYKAWGTASKLLLPFTTSSFNSTGIFLNAWLANTPQVLLSIAYFSINRICTSVCFALEWNNYAKQRKGLRVTSPSCEQRQTHFLQIPYRWAIPLAVTSGLLHWLLSQTLFLVRFEKRKLDGTMYPDSTCACGYSPVSLLIFTLCFCGLLIVLLGILVTPITAYIPIAGHSSMIISAACHPPPGDMYAHLGKVQWGSLSVTDDEGVGHCTFTSGPVITPSEGAFYI